MLIIYTCPNCKAKRYLTSIQSESPLCKNCQSAMAASKDDISSEIMTTEEARYLGDEAIYNTVGSRLANKRAKHFATN